MLKLLFPLLVSCSRCSSSPFVTAPPKCYLTLKDPGGANAQLFHCGTGCFWQILRCICEQILGKGVCQDTLLALRWACWWYSHCTVELDESTWPRNHFQLIAQKMFTQGPFPPQAFCDAINYGRCNLERAAKHLFPMMLKNSLQ